MNTFDTSRSIVQEVQLPEFNNHGVKLFIKRDDLIDKEVSGNKWRKLKYNIQHAKSNSKKGILTFGGAFSNHLLATASACSNLGMSSVGIVRGDELNANSNPILKRCSELGMQLIFVSREMYENRHDRSYHEVLMLQFPEHAIVPEGGANYYGMIGCQEIITETTNDYDYIILAQGTTTTSCGVALAMSSNTKLLAVPVLKGFEGRNEMKQLMNYAGFSSEIIDDVLENVLFLDQYHFGGYGKYTTELLGFMEEFYNETQIPLDPIYTGKVMYALID
jgi:1-aminocyclopropane-1-carboxylate deaminase